MSQTFTTITGTIQLGGFPSIFNANIDAIRSQWSGTSAPASPVVGQPFYNTTTGYITIWNGTSWIDPANTSTTVLANTAELLEARGTTASLNTRLSVSLNDDGTLKGAAPVGDWWMTEADDVAFVDASTFTVSGDKTAIYLADRAVLLTQTSTDYGYVVSSSYNGETDLTTVVVVDAVVDSGLSAVEYGQPPTNAPFDSTSVKISDIGTTVLAPDGDGSSLTGITKTPGRNILDNPDFSVNQYGLDSTGATFANGEYFIDRWYLQETATNPTVKLGADGGVVVVFNATEAGRANIEQKVENYLDYAGKTITLSAKITTTDADGVVVRIADGVGGVTSTVHTASGSEVLTVTYTVDSAPIWLYTRVGQVTSRSNTSGDSFEIEWVKMELGDTATDFEPPNPAEELAKCSGYLLSVPYLSGTQLGVGYATNATTIDINIFAPIYLTRSDPAVTIPAIGDFRLTSSGTNITPASLSVFSAGGGFITLRFVVTGATALETYVLRAETAGNIILDNNL